MKNKTHIVLKEKIKKIKKKGINWFILPVKKINSLSKNKNYKMLDVGSHIRTIEEYLPRNIIYDTLDCTEKYSNQNTFIHNLDEFPIKIPDNSYDIIMCLETLEHTMYPNKIMKELIRIAKPNALFLISLPNDYNIVMRLYYLLGIKKETAPPFTIVEEHMHIHTLRKKDIIKFYKKYFNIDEIDYNFSFKTQICYGIFGMGFLNWIFNILSSILPNLFARSVGVSGKIKENFI